MQGLRREEERTSREPLAAQEEEGLEGSPTARAPQEARFNFPLLQTQVETRFNFDSNAVRNIGASGAVHRESESNATETPL